MQGKFISFNLPYIENGKSLSGEAQALRILNFAEDMLSHNKYLGVAISYSANYDQTLHINNCYKNKQWYTGTNGANQASVMNAMEELLNDRYHNLQGKIRIAPITTMSYSGFHGKTHEEIILNDLKNIETLVRAGWCVLGWKNQTSSPYFAVGGGIANLPQPLSELIQNKLRALENVN